MICPTDFWKMLIDFLKIYLFLLKGPEWAGREEDASPWPLQPRGCITNGVPIKGSRVWGDVNWCLHGRQWSSAWSCWLPDQVPTCCFQHSCCVLAGIRLHCDGGHLTKQPFPAPIVLCGHRGGPLTPAGWRGGADALFNSTFAPRKCSGRTKCRRSEQQWRKFMAAKMQQIDRRL